MYGFNAIADKISPNKYKLKLRKFTTKTAKTNEEWEKLLLAENQKFLETATQTNSINSTTENNLSTSRGFSPQRSSTPTELEISAQDSIEQIAEQTFSINPPPATNPTLNYWNNI